MTHSFTIISPPPPPAGYLEIVGGLRIETRSKPRLLHRWMMRAVFGWKWYPR